MRWHEHGRLRQEFLQTGTERHLHNDGDTERAWQSDAKRFVIGIAAIAAAELNIAAGGPHPVYQGALSFSERTRWTG